MSEKRFFEAEHIFAGYGKKAVIHGISFSLRPCTLTALIGANGSGKTTLMKCIANQLNHGGSSILQGKSLEDMSVKERARNVSYIPQRSGISISLPVLDVVLMGFNLGAAEFSDAANGMIKGLLSGDNDAAAMVAKMVEMMPKSFKNQ